MRAEEIRGLSDGDLAGRIAEMEREQFNLRFKSGTQPLEDPLRLRALRKDLARLKTIRHERELGLVRATPETAAAAKPAARKTGAKKATAKKTTAKKTTAKKTAAKATTTRATAKTAKKAPSKRAGGSSR